MSDANCVLVLGLELDMVTIMDVWMILITACVMYLLARTMTYEGEE